MSSNSSPCPRHDLKHATLRRPQINSPATCRSEISSSRTKRNKEWRRIYSIRRAMRRLNGMWPLGSYVPLHQRIFMGHWKFVKVTEAAFRSAIGHEVALLVAHCTERRLGKKKHPKSFFNSMEILNGDHLKPVCEWLTPLLDNDFGGSGLPLSYRSKWFKVKVRSRRKGSRVVDYPVYVPKIPRWMIEFGYEPHYHTEEWIPNGDAETEQDHLIKYLDAHFAWDLLGGRFFACKERDLSFEKAAIQKRLHLQEMRETTLELFSSGYRKFY